VSVESWAQKIVEDELQEPVEVYDDGSQNSMYDLRIGPADSPAIAIECVGAVDMVQGEESRLQPG
jgi:hypothetical protein